MATIDPEKERQRLAQMYGAMTPEQLEKIASESQELSDEAWTVLNAERLRRGQAPLPEKTEEDNAPYDPGEPSAVLLRRFRDLPEALLAKGRLETSGINCFLADDNMVRLDWFISNLLGGVKLMVDEADAEEADAILNQPTPESFEVDAVGEYQQPRCPNCGSLDVSFEELDKKFSYATAYFHVPIPMHNQGWNCHACKHRWDGPADEAPG
jgi:hypothetical protein